MVITKVTWNPPGNPDQVALMQQKSSVMVSEGKTDGVTAFSYPNGEGNPPTIAQRSWTNLSAAQEWSDYLNSLEIVPESIEIVQ